MTVSFPTLVISRRPRHVGSGRGDAPSRFGGEPRLGGRRHGALAVRRHGAFQFWVRPDDLAAGNRAAARDVRNVLTGSRPQTVFSRRCPSAG